MICLVLTLIATSVSSQAQPSSEVAAERAGSSQLRYQLRVVERAFEETVEHSARNFASSMEELTPGAARFMGNTGAHGFRLDGYGLFFDVQIPVLRRSLSWVFRHLNRGHSELGPALQSLRQHMRSFDNGDVRDSLEEALRSIESLVGRPPPPPPPPPPDFDPGEMYAMEIRDALANAMLDYTDSLPLAANEWLTVATTSSGNRADSPTDLPRGLGLMLRVRGNVLIALRQGEITRSEALDLIEYSEF